MVDFLAGLHMQRLFVMFPDRAPGIGLLLLRLQIAAVLLIAVMPGDTGSPTLRVLAGIGAALLVVGWLTPLSALLAVLVLWIGREPLLLGLPACLLLVGPGAYALDAHLFGRRVVSPEMTGEDDPPKE